MNLSPWLHSLGAVLGEPCIVKSGKSLSLKQVSTLVGRQERDLVAKGPTFLGHLLCIQSSA